MEVTQYKSCVIPTLQRSKTYIAFVQKLESSLLAFPMNYLPKSSIVFPINDGTTTQRRMFTELFEKYIDDAAEWKIKIGAQCKNELVELYRRCKISRTKHFSVYNANSSILAGDTFNHSSTEFEDLPPISTIRTLGLESKYSKDAKYGLVDPKDLKAMVEALDNALIDVIERLKKSFDQYKQTEVWLTFILTVVTEKNCLL